jgi:hypothetical protein
VVDGYFLLPSAVILTSSLVRFEVDVLTGCGHYKLYHCTISENLKVFPLFSQVEKGTKVVSRVVKWEELTDLSADCWMRCQR